MQQGMLPESIAIACGRNPCVYHPGKDALMTGMPRPHHPTHGYIIQLHYYTGIAGDPEWPWALAMQDTPVPVNMIYFKQVIVSKA